MPTAQPPPEGPDRDEEGVDPQQAMERFKRLAKGLLSVPREKVAEAERVEQNGRSGGAGRPRN